ncbi:hypothetical protein CBR_g31882 [Chara braunii]|uniref:Oxysterol-binding protein n=1 Tax=Chara braunii TaxID=69332 RepID=A0A388LFW2_CHABU|nr:hypothetical protein CBR_g31882 [Chara braunii]|eukprot:GBG81210.1 hypothetical protein CBR_g31882 [Chara braunii]
MAATDPQAAPSMTSQVSHRPPVTALYATDTKKNVRLLWHQEPCPRFYGSWMEAAMKGRRLLMLDEYKETYEFSSPRLSFRFLPIPGAEWVGTCKVGCAKTGYEAQVHFKAKSLFGLGGGTNRVEGRIKSISSKKTLYEIDGYWDSAVTIKDMSTGKKKMFYEVKGSMAELRMPQLVNPQDVARTESVLVWGKVTRALLKGDWAKASRAKKVVEDNQRMERKLREKEGKTWQAKFFQKLDNGDWVWRYPDQPVLPAPIQVPLPTHGPYIVS